MNANTKPKPARPSILESPWYWIYAFCTAALIGLVLFGGKLTTRQAHVERNFQGRQRTLEQRAGETPTTGLSEEGDTALSLKPLYLMLGAGLVGAWIVLWWGHFRYRRPAAPPSDASVPATGNAPSAGNQRLARHEVGN